MSFSLLRKLCILFFWKGERHVLELILSHMYTKECRMWNKLDTPTFFLSFFFLLFDHMNRGNVRLHIHCWNIPLIGSLTLLLWSPWYWLADGVGLELLQLGGLLVVARNTVARFGRPCQVLLCWRANIPDFKGSLLDKRCLKLPFRILTLLP